MLQLTIAFVEVTGTSGSISLVDSHAVRDQGIGSRECCGFPACPAHSIRFGTVTVLSTEWKGQTFSTQMILVARRIKKMIAGSHLERRAERRITVDHWAQL